MILSPGNGPSWALSRWRPCSPRLSSIIFVWRGPRAGPRRLRAGDICWGGCSAALHTVWWRHNIKHRINNFRTFSSSQQYARIWDYTIKNTQDIIGAALKTCARQMFPFKKFPVPLSLHIAPMHAAGESQAGVCPLVCLGQAGESE